MIIELYFLFKYLLIAGEALRIMAPPAIQRTAHHEDCCAYPRSVVDGKSFYVEYPANHY